LVAQTNRKNEHKYRKQIKQIGRSACHKRGGDGSTIALLF
jgi:hypothetical protein